ncbi:MAG: type IV pilus twitching motility protein PilT [Acidimicrobiia bacterium]
MADLHHYLHQLLEHRGSDLHLKVGAVPHVRVDGKLTPLLGNPLSIGDLEAMVDATLPDARRVELDRFGDTDFAISVNGVGRFRVNVHRQRGSYGVVVRCVPPGLPSWDQLGLPVSIRRLVETTSGLVLIAGPAGSGRSTTAAMLLDHVNATRAASIVTFEHPIEVLHPDKRSLVSQREVGADTPGFAEGIMRVIRQDCDVLYVSDVADAAVANGLLVAATSGRLVIAVVTAVSVVNAVSGFLDLFPEADRPVVRRSLGGCLRGVSVQHLVDRTDGRGRVPAVEVMVGTSRVSEVMLEPTKALEQLDRVISEGTYNGMQPMQQSLYELCVENMVSIADALRLASAPEDLRIALEKAGLAAR